MPEELIGGWGFECRQEAVEVCQANRAAASCVLHWCYLAARSHPPEPNPPGQLV
jgi:hypothetical protein